MAKPLEKAGGRSLTLEEEGRLNELEKLYASGKFVSGMALDSIEQEGLWRLFDSFPRYCESRLHIGENYARKLIHAWVTCKNLQDSLPGVPVEKLLTESHCRALETANVPESQQATVVAEALAQTVDPTGKPKKLTASLIKHVAAGLGFGKHVHGNDKPGAVGRAAPKDPDVIKDQEGATVPKNLRTIFDPERVVVFGKLAAELNDVMLRLQALQKLPHGQRIPDGLWITIKNAIADVRGSQPWIVCPKCRGKGCRDCFEEGWFPKGTRTKRKEKSDGTED